MACRWTVLALALIACKGEESVAETAPQTAGCADPLELALPDGSCIRPGVPVDACAAGFEHDGEYGCQAILPAEPCPDGTMAVPGETTCAPLIVLRSGALG